MTVSINLAFTATGNSHAVWDHTVLPTTRQWWESRLYPRPKQVHDLATPKRIGRELNPRAVNRKSNALPLSHAWAWREWRIDRKIRSDMCDMHNDSDMFVDMFVYIMLQPQSFTWSRRGSTCRRVKMDDDVTTTASPPTCYVTRATEPPPHVEFYELSRLITGLVIYPIVCVVGLAGNSLALVVFSRPAMVTSYNVLLATMAANDLVKLLNDLLYFFHVILLVADPPAANRLFVHVYPASHYIFNQVLNHGICADPLSSVLIF